MLSVLLGREPHVDVPSQLLALVDNGRLEGWICATTATTIYYNAAKSFGTRRAQAQVQALLGLFGVALEDKQVLRGALDLGFSDYADAVVHEAARATGATAIVTRDRGGFARATLPVLEPAELLASIAAAG